MPPHFLHLPFVFSAYRGGPVGGGNLALYNSLIPLSRYQSCLFHAGRVLKTENVSHYKILGLEPSASATDIKKSFYALSKKHHPDHNPGDTHAAERFVEISEAYAILGNPPKREKYDRETQRATSSSSNNAPRGSYWSSAPYGARPASGLSKRRTPFHGPPPSFYRSGGYGAHEAKRQRQADSTASAHASAASGSGNAGPSTAGGFGPAGSAGGLDNDVPHFDRYGHTRTQEQQDQRRVRRAGEGEIDYVHGGSIFLNFILVSGILAVACLVPAVFVQRKKARQSDKEAV
ncbi:MAG: hypothetical protein L6R39_001367 [Caloplaca ligustica]|nr:MAG: hypothetical protein L6R39_001367 [Caloplaca ligustica]